MAQAHFLPPLPPSSPNSDADHMVLLRELLTKNSHLVFALPTFTADSQPPSVAYLLGTYAPPPPASSDGF